MAGAFDSAAIVGRAAERGILTGVLRGVLDSAASAMVAVVGEPGIGKTTMLRGLAVDAADAGCLVLEGRAAEFERDVPFGLFVDAIDVHLAALDRSRLQRLGPGLLGQLAAVFPALEEHAGGPVRVVDSERFRLHRAVRSLLERLAAGRGLVLLLDDLHWADAASCELVASLLRRPPDAAVLVALAYRSGQVPAMLVSEMSAADRAGTLRRVQLGPLTREQSDLLADTASLTPAARERLFTDSGGNPFYLQQLARVAQYASQHTVTGVAHRRTDDAVIGDVPPEVAAALAVELATLSESARTVAQAAAIAGEPFDADLLSDIAGLPHKVVFEALDELLERNLVRATTVSREFRFRHPLVRQGVYHSVGGGSRLAAHARAATALATRGASAIACAPHVEASASVGDEHAVTLLMAAGAAAAGRAPATAAHWLQAALRLVPDCGPASVRKDQLVPQIAAALAAAGQLEDSRRLLADALAGTSRDDIANTIELVTACATVENLLGRHADARARLIAARDTSDHRALVVIELELSLLCVLAADLDGARDHARHGLTGAERLDSDLLRAAALARLCFAEGAAGRRSAYIAAYEPGAALVAKLDDAILAERLDTFWTLGWGGWFIGCYADSERQFAYGIELSLRSGRSDRLIELTAGRSASLTVLGQVERALSLAQEVVDAAGLTNVPLRLMWSQIAHCYALTAAGDVAAAVDVGLQSVAIARAEDMTTTAGSSRAGWVTAAALIEIGDGQQAAAILLELLGGPDLPRYFAGLHPLCYEILTRAALLCGRLDEAADWARRATKCEAASEVPIMRALANRAQAEVLLADHQPSRAAECALLSAAEAATTGARIDAARARLLAGRALAATNERERAGTELRQAEAELAACGAQRLRTEAVRELRRLGMRVHRAGRRGAANATGIAALSGREREIADLVTARKTNREIAAELFLSEKTVERHLSHIFVKLAAKSRVEVARALERYGIDVGISGMEISAEHANLAVRSTRCP